MIGTTQEIHHHTLDHHHTVTWGQLYKMFYLLSPDQVTAQSHPAYAATSSLKLLVILLQVQVETILILIY